MLEASMIFLIMWLSFIVVSEESKLPGFSVKIPGAFGFIWAGIYIVIWAGWMEGYLLAALASIIGIIIGLYQCFQIFRQGWRVATLDQLYRPLVMLLFNVWILHLILRTWL